MRFIALLWALLCLCGCQQTREADYLITGGKVYLGDNTPGDDLVVAIKDGEIVYVGVSSETIDATHAIDASGLYVLPGFIDPHTHSIGELLDEDPLIRRNVNYLTQGVTTVVNGNDGYGDPDIAGLKDSLESEGIGTNTALFIGHGALRDKVMGREKRSPTDAELSVMKSRVDLAMDDGALGLSTGLFYAPGSFSETDEVIELAKVAALKGGVFDSHIRDEATYNIGLEAAVQEVIDIARDADIHANIAHIKALGVDVWGKSKNIVEMVESAHAEGLSISADQYPWQASGTRISNALIPRWVKAGGETEYMARLNNAELIDQIKTETRENLRKRGGPEAVLITQDKFDWQNKTLGQIAKANNLDPVDMAKEIARKGDARIASFNMNADDIEAFMRQPWVMTSSDGSTGHPRKFASYPQKYREYVVAKSIMPVETFFYRSSGLVADNFNLCGRGYLKPGYAADILIMDPKQYAPKADFQNPEKLSVGVVHLFVNGQPAIQNGELKTKLSGQFVPRCTKEN